MSTNTTEKNDSPTGEGRGWTMPHRSQQVFRAGLYMVATPIGNLGDMTLRALDVLARADVVVCEDTRVSGKLMAHFGLKKVLMTYNDHSDAGVRGKIVSAVQEGQVVALISDAGMPMISDPGYKLVQACHEAEIYVSSVPGANAPLMALQLSGVASDAFCFLGFLPSKSAARVKMLGRWADVQASLITFENASRVLATLKDIRAVLGVRQVAIARELTKMYEDVRRGSVDELITGLEGGDALKGEVVLVIEGAGEIELSQEDVEAALGTALETMSTKEAAAHVAQMSGRPRKELYDLALRLGKL